MHYITAIITIIFFVAIHNSNAQKIKMLKDINEGNGDGLALFTHTNLGTKMPVIINDIMYFPAETNNNKSAIWKSDGTTEGTIKVGGEDINIQYISNLCSYNNNILFSGDGSLFGSELHLLNTKNDEYSLVKDLWEGPHASSPRNLSICDNHLLFEIDIYSEDPAQQLYVTDGTAEGTHPFVFSKEDSVKMYGVALAGNTINLPPLLFKNYVLPGEVYFGRVGMTDLTTKKTEILSDSQQISGQRNFTTFKEDTNFVFISYTGEMENLWISDGRSQNTKVIFSAGRIFSPTTFNGEIYFWARDSAQFSDYSLMRTDGTPDGTKRVKYFHHIAWHGYGQPDKIVVFNNKLLISTIGSDGKSVLWMSKGDEDSTVPIAEIEADFSQSIIFDNKLYFAGYTPETGWEVWYMDSANNIPILFHDLYEGSESSLRPRNSSIPLPCFFTFNNKLFFQANDGVHGTEYHYIESEIKTGVKESSTIFDKVKIEIDNRSNILTVSDIPENTTTLEIYNFLGEKIASEKVDSRAFQFEVKTLSSGNYTAVLKDDRHYYAHTFSIVH